MALSIQGYHEIQTNGGKCLMTYYVVLFLAILSTTQPCSALWGTCTLQAYWDQQKILLDNSVGLVLPPSLQISLCIVELLPLRYFRTLSNVLYASNVTDIVHTAWKVVQHTTDWMAREPKPCSQWVRTLVGKVNRHLCSSRAPFVEILLNAMPAILLVCRQGNVVKH